MSAAASLIACAVVLGETEYALSIFFAASRRNKAHIETSLKCLSVTFAPLALKACLTTLCVYTCVIVCVNMGIYCLYMHLSMHVRQCEIV